MIQDDDLTSDSEFGTDSSDTTSVSSSMFEGYLENGRRYQTKREGEYWGPSDEKQVCILPHPDSDCGRSCVVVFKP